MEDARNISFKTVRKVQSLRERVSGDCRQLNCITRGSAVVNLISVGRDMWKCYVETALQSNEKADCL